MNKILIIGGGIAAVAVAMYLAKKDKGAPTPTPGPEGGEGGKDAFDPEPILPAQKLEPVLPPAPPVGVQTVVPVYLQPPAPRVEEILPAYQIPQVYPTPEPAQVYIPSPAAPIAKQIINPESNVQPPAMQPVAPLPAIAVKYPPGSLLRAGDSDKVYLVNDRGQIQWITNRKRFDSMGFNMKSVKSIPASDMSKFQRGADLSGFRGSLGMAYILN